MKKLLLLALLMLGGVLPAQAQQHTDALVVPSCGSESLTAAAYGYVTMDTTGKLCDGSSGGGSPANAPGSTFALGATFVKGTTAAMTGTSATQVIAAVSSKIIYVTRVKCNNSGATATLVQITDGSAGTVLDTLAAGATYGGEQGTGPTPLFWTTSGNGLYAQDVTTGASVICTASGYSG